MEEEEEQEEEEEEVEEVEDEGFCVFHEPLSLLHLPLKPVIVRTSKCTNNIDNQVHKMGRHRHGHIIIAPIDDVSRVSKKSEY